MTDDEPQAVVESERAELQRRLRCDHGDRPAIPVDGRPVIAVDDALVTGGLARAGARVLCACGAARIVLGVQVGSPDLPDGVGDEVDELVGLEAPSDFFEVGKVHDAVDRSATRGCARCSTARSHRPMSPTIRPGFAGSAASTGAKACARGERA